MTAPNTSSGARSVLISGAGTGIGATAARHLASRGWTVYAGVLQASEGTALKSDSKDAANIRPLVLDVTRLDSIEAALKTIAGERGAGGLQGLINNAGVYHGAPLQYLTVEEIQQTVTVNLLGTMLLTRAALPLLRQGRGRVVINSSAMGFLAMPTIGVYGATKAGLAALAGSLRLELAVVGVPVTLLEPGAVKTGLTAAGADKLRAFLDRMSDEDRRAYQPLLQKIVDMSDPAKSGMDPQQVASAMASALERTRPWRRYRVGGAAKAARAVSLLPAGVLDRLLSAGLGIRRA